MEGYTCGAFRLSLSHAKLLISSLHALLSVVIQDYSKVPYRVIVPSALSSQAEGSVEAVSKHDIVSNSEQM